MKNLFAVVMALALAACASSVGFDRAVLKAQMREPQVIDDKDIQAAFEKHAQIQAPFRVAVYFDHSNTHYSGRFLQWRWTSEDKEQLFSIRDNLKAQGVVSDMYLLNDGLVQGNDHKAIRLAAARTGADALLEVKGTGEIDRYSNTWGMSYFLILPLFFMPGTQTDGLFISDATVWDVRNDFLYGSMEVEGAAKKTSSFYDADTAAVLTNAKSEAMSKLSKDLSQHLLSMVGK